MEKFMKRKIIILIVCALIATVCAVLAFACNKSEKVGGLKLKADGDGYQICETSDSKLNYGGITARANLPFDARTGCFKII